MVVIADTSPLNYPILIGNAECSIVDSLAITLPTSLNKRFGLIDRNADASFELAIAEFRQSLPMSQSAFNLLALP